MTEREESLRLLEQEIGVLLRRVKRVLVDRSRLVHPELQSPAYLLLSWIAEQGPLRSSTLAEEFAIDKAAVTRQVQHLEELGLVERTPDPADGRATLLSASKDAVRRLRVVEKARRAVLDERLGDWTAEELDVFARELARYNKTLS